MQSCPLYPKLRYPLLVTEGAKMEEMIAMSRKEVDRLGVIQATATRQLYQSEAAGQLGLRDCLFRVVF